MKLIINATISKGNTKKINTDIAAIFTIYKVKASKREETLKIIVYKFGGLIFPLIFVPDYKLLRLTLPVK